MPTVEGLSPEILWYTLIGLVGLGSLIVLGDKQGIALVPVEAFETGLRKAMEYASKDANVTEPWTR